MAGSRPGSAVARGVGLGRAVGCGHRLRPLARKQQIGLTGPQHLDIDVGQELAVDQGAVLVAHGGVDAIALAQGVEARLGAWVLAPRHGERIDDPAHRYRSELETGQFVIEEIDIEIGVVDHERRVADEIHEVARELVKTRLVPEELGRDAMHLEGAFRHVAVGIEVGVPLAARGKPVDQLQATDLDDPVASLGIKPRRFRVQYDLAQQVGLPILQGLPARKSRSGPIGRVRCSHSTFELFHDSVDLRLRLGNRAAGVHNEIGTPEFF